MEKKLERDGQRMRVKDALFVLAESYKLLLAFVNVCVRARDKEKQREREGERDR